MSKVIDKREAWRLIYKTGNKFFSVKFIKKTDGRLRHMNCILGSATTKQINGGGRVYDFESRGLIPVYTVAGDKSENPGNRRVIPIDNVFELRAGGVVYEVID